MLLSELKKITDRLLKIKEEQLSGKLLEIFYKDNFKTSFKSSSDILLNTGLAISSIASRDCLSEHLRTVKFIKGVNNAIQKLLTQKKAIEIVYVGCGVYAPLINSVLHYFPREVLNITVLDVNEESLKSAKKTFKKLYADTYNVNFLLEDGSKYKHTKKVDLLIAECMYAGLTNEPQYYITKIFKNQLSDIGKIVPEKILISVNDVTTELSSSTDLNKAIVLDDNLNKDVIMSTKVVINEDIILKKNESSITRDLHILHKETIGKTKKVILKYELSPTPIWKVELIK